MGFTNVKALKGGWDLWKEKGYPVEPTGPEDL
jgi:3-mercaptopyruvate sulfurtransferase SseA